MLRNVGMAKIAIVQEAKRHISTTMGMAFINLPIIPERSIRGIKAAVIHKKVTVTGHITSAVPFTIASPFFNPISIYLKEFSETTIPKSTIIPRTIINPKRLIIFIVTPAPLRPINATINTRGMVAVTREAILTPNIKNSIPAKSTNPVAASTRTESMLCLV